MPVNSATGPSIFASGVDLLGKNIVVFVWFNRDVRHHPVHNRVLAMMKLYLRKLVLPISFMGIRKVTNRLSNLPTRGSPSSASDKLN